MTPLTAPDELTRETLALIIPPDVAAVSTARLFLSAVARGAGFEDDDIQDLRLAASEATTSAVRAHGSVAKDSAIEIRVSPSGEHIDVEILSGPGFDETENSLSLTVIHALYSHVETAKHADGRTALRFRAGKSPA